ncbi:MAG: metallophosphoesterase [Paludibaculum sp.]
MEISPTALVGSIGECSPKYDGTRHAQTYAFQALFDRTAGSDYRTRIATASFLRGLRQISDDIPLHYALYPELGNHDLSHFDINDGSSKLVDYVKSWNPDATGDHKVTNRDSDSGAYSMDWGNLHVIVVGVSPGASGHEYRYSESSMDWFRKDLATYANDGRPVVIAQHFGFDTAWSLTNDFWQEPDRIEGFMGLWPAIKDYNVVGFFTGHDHSVGKPYRFPDWNTFPNSMGYDVFRPGAGYSQQFAAIRVTDHSMDVAYTQQKDYDSSGNVALASDEYGLFTKKLVPGPKLHDGPASVDRPGAATRPGGGHVHLRWELLLPHRGRKSRRRGFAGRMAAASRPPRCRPESCLDPSRTCAATAWKRRAKPGS